MTADLPSPSVEGEEPTTEDNVAGAASTEATVRPDHEMLSLLLRWRNGALEGDAVLLADLTDETTDFLAALTGASPSEPSREDAVELTDGLDRPSGVYMCLACGSSVTAEYARLGSAAPQRAPCRTAWCQLPPDHQGNCEGDQ